MQLVLEDCKWQKIFDSNERRCRLPNDAEKDVGRSRCFSCLFYCVLCRLHSFLAMIIIKFVSGVIGWCGVVNEVVKLLQADASILIFIHTLQCSRSSETREGGTESIKRVLYLFLGQYTVIVYVAIEEYFPELLLTSRIARQCGALRVVVNHCPARNF
ncbi:hypothetical protein GQ457_01G026560 [Hibiscus cannabinus]